MRRDHRFPGTILLAFAVVGCLAPGVRAAEEVADPVRVESPEAMESMRELMRLFYAGELEDLRSRFREAFRQQMSLETLQRVHQRITGELGAEVAVEEESLIDQGEFRLYTRKMRFEKAQFPFKFSWSVGREDGQVVAFFVKALPDEQAPEAVREAEPPATGSEPLAASEPKAQPR